MNLPSNELIAIALVVLAVAFILVHDDLVPWYRWTRRLIRRVWSNTVGAFFARRRMRIRVPPPDEHSPGIMVMRRDVSTGWWT